MPSAAYSAFSTKGALSHLTAIHTSVETGRLGPLCGECVAFQCLLGFSRLLPTLPTVQRQRQIRLIGDSKLPVGMNVSVNDCQSPLCNDWFLSQLQLGVDPVIKIIDLNINCFYKMSQLC